MFLFNAGNFLFWKIFQSFPRTIIPKPIEHSRGVKPPVYNSQKNPFIINFAFQKTFLLFFEPLPKRRPNFPRKFPFPNRPNFPPLTKKCPPGGGEPSGWGASKSGHPKTKATLPKFPYKEKNPSFKILLGPPLMPIWGKNTSK